MIDISDFMQNNISICNVWFIDELISKYIKENYLNNSSYEDIEKKIIDFLENKPDFQYEQKTGRIIYKTNFYNHPLIDRLQSLNSQLNGRVLSTSNTIRFSNKIERTELIGLFKDYFIDNIILLDSNISITLKHVSIYINVNITARDFKISAYYDLKEVSENIQPYLEFLKEKGDYQLLKKGHLPLDHGIYEVFLLISTFFHQKYDNFTFIIYDFNQHN